MTKHTVDPIIVAIKNALKEQGVDLQALASRDGAPFKVVAIAANMADVANEMSASSRDQVLMVRTDSQTLAQLDHWVEAGAAKSRSEAAALFLREGLKVRTSELLGLSEALKDVETARNTLRVKAQSLLGTAKELDTSAIKQRKQPKKR